MKTFDSTPSGNFINKDLRQLPSGKYTIFGWVICRVFHPSACRRVKYSANYSPEDCVFARGQLPKVFIYEIPWRSRIKSLHFSWSTWRIQSCLSILHQFIDGDSRSVIDCSCKVSFVFQFKIKNSHITYTKRSRLIIYFELAVAWTRTSTCILLS